MNVYIQSTNNLFSNGIKVLLYGAFGVGKTPSCASAPNPLFISGEKGLLSLAGQNMPYVEFTNYQQLVDIGHWIISSHEAQQFHTPIVDSVSELAEVCLSEAKKKYKDPRKAYGDIQDEVISIIKFFRDLPRKNVIIVAKEEFNKDEQLGTMLFQPMLPGQKLGPKLPYYFDEVFRMMATKNPADGKIYRYFSTQASYQHMARDRSGKLGEYEYPDFTNIFRKILGV